MSHLDRIRDSVRLRSKAFVCKCRRVVIADIFRNGNYLSGEMRDFDFSGGEMPFPRNELSGSCILELVDVPAREFCYVDPLSGRWVIVDLSRRALSNSVVRWRATSLRRTLLGLTDHHEQRAFEDKERHSNHFTRRRAARLL